MPKGIGIQSIEDMSIDDIFPDYFGMQDTDDLFPQGAEFPSPPALPDSPFGQESVFHQDFDNKQQAERYLRDILSLMQKNGITEFYYTHLPSGNANSGILFHGEIIKGKLTVTLVPTRFLIVNERFLYEILQEKTGFKIATNSKGNLLIKGKDTEWKLIPTGNAFASLPFYTQDYMDRITANDHSVRYQELQQIYEEMLAKKAQLPVGDKESIIPKLSAAIQRKLDNPFYRDVLMHVYIKQVDALGNVVAETMLKTDYKTLAWDVKLNITVRPGGQLEIKHVASGDYLKKHLNRWKTEARARGLDVNIEALRKEVINDFESHETEKSFFDRFILQSRALFNDKIAGYAEGILATQKVAKHVWEAGTINESTWYSRDEEHGKWPEYMRLYPVVGGVTDGAVDEILGIPMAVKGIYEIATDEEKQEALKALFTSEGMEQMYEGLKQEVKDTYNDSEKSEHFVGQTTVSVGSMFLGGAGLFTKAGKLGEVLDTVSGFIRRISNPKVIKVYEDIRNFFLRKPKEGGIEVNDYLKKLDDDALNEFGEELVEETDELARLKAQPQKFIDGKNYENAIRKLVDEGNPVYLSKVAQEAGISLEELNTYIPLHQVQIRIPNTNGGFTTMDDVWVKKVTDPVTGKEYLEAIVNDCKLSKDAPFSKRQLEFEKALDNQNSYFDLRNTKFQDLENISDRILQNTEIRVKTYIKTMGNGGSPPDLTKFTIEKIR